MEVIWNSQNPADCSKAKYLITEPFLQGVGSEMHVYGVGLGIAIETGRVFLQQGGWSWRFKNAHCASQNKKNMECYYLPLSRCTLEDAMSTMHTTNTEYPQPLPPSVQKSDSSVTESTRQLSGGRSKPRPRPLPVNGTNTKPSSASGNKSPLGVAQNVGWSGKADADLEAAVIRHGVQGQWQKIAAVMAQHGKTDTECLFRFRNALRKKMNSRGGPVSRYLSFSKCRLLLIVRDVSLFRDRREDPTSTTTTR